MVLSKCEYTDNSNCDGTNTNQHLIYTDLQTKPSASGPQESEKNVVVRQRNFRPVEAAEILRAYDSWSGENKKNAFIRWVQKQYKRPKFQRKTLNRWLKNKESIMESAKTVDKDRRFLLVPRQSTGKFPEMECALAAHIRELRGLGIVVETWMVSKEAKMLLHEFYPMAFPCPPDLEGDEDDTFGFRCR